MCGLAGFLLRSPGPQADALGRTVSAMAERLRLRGPDDSGEWADGEAGIALGFRRLAIIDLSPAGHQPMTSASGRFVIAFNGEIYNFRALRAELEALGVRFRSHSDTEVIVEAAAQWGIEAAVKRLNGMFAIALWDRQRRELTLARDRLGIKPLYWGWQRDVLFFGSQPKAFAAHPAWAPALDRNALRAYFRFACVPAPLSVWQGIAKLEPGCMVTLDARGRVDHRRYWNLLEVASQPPDSAMSDAEATDALEALLKDAVAGQMVSDVPIGAFLSGGVDSSTVAALMQKASPRPIRTFTIGFDAVGYDESAAARAVARHIGSDHLELVAQPKDALDLAPAMAEHYDEPFADASQIPTCLVSHLTRQHVTVALSGDGGDESFAGYNRYEAQRLWQRLMVLPAPLRRLFAGAVLAVPPQRWDALFAAAGSKLPLAGSKMHKFATISTADSIQELYRRLVSQWRDPGLVVPDGVEPAGPLDDTQLPARLPDPLQRLQYLDLATYLPDDILAKVDRASMAYSLEARVPLLDHRVVEFALRQPSHRKQRDGRGKWLLRQVLYRHVPAELVDRPKAGFAVPIDAWLRGPLRPWAEDLLSEKSLRDTGLVQPAPVRAAWAAHLSGRRSLHYPLWCVLMAQSWHRRWMAG
jgi:asparagine synthase (glutamine-hydrolysing)